MKQSVLNVMHDIAIHLNKETQECEFSYIQQRETILRVFKEGKLRYDVPTIILRLTVIDSLYSTNAQYSYFSIEDMANELFSLGSNEKDAVEYFKQIALGGNDSKNLFNKEYGIRKNCNAGSKQMSLMSKYAYYTLLCDNSSALGFPIYDSLVIKMYPIMWEKMFGIKTTIEKECIEKYVASLNALRKKLFDNNDLFYGMQQFDILDAYLWRMGKLNGGNYSLLLTRSEYVRFISNLGLNSVVAHANTKFNENVALRCREMDTQDILQGTERNKNILTSLIDHWKTNY